MKSHLTLLLEELSSSDRNKLIAKLDIHYATWFRWRNNPGSIPVAKAEVIKSFLDERDGVDYNMADLLQPITPPGNRKAS